MTAFDDFLLFSEQILTLIGALTLNEQVTATKHLHKITQLLESYVKGKERGVIKQTSPGDVRTFVLKFIDLDKGDDRIHKATKISIVKSTSEIPRRRHVTTKKPAAVSPVHRTVPAVSTRLSTNKTGQFVVDVETPLILTMTESSNHAISTKEESNHARLDAVKVEAQNSVLPSDVRGNPRIEDRCADDFLLAKEEDECHNIAAEQSSLQHPEAELDHSTVVQDTKSVASSIPQTVDEPMDQSEPGDDDESIDSDSMVPSSSVIEKAGKLARSTLCTICGRNFSTHCSLQVHMRSHDGERPYMCSICPRTFTTKGNLQRHERVHLGIKNFECKFCDKKFAEKKAKQVHERIHEGVKPYKCETCGAAFTQRCTLLSHQHTHTGWKGHLCDVCGANFRQKSQLSQHKLRHSAEKPFTCDQCDARFSVKGDLQRHRSVHTTTKPFQCSQCDRSFSRLNYLSDHMNWHSGYRPYQCPKCPASYSEKSAYYKHINKDHGPAGRTVQKTVLPLTEPRTILVGEDSALLNCENLVTVSQDEGDTFILYTDGAGKQQLIPVHPSSDCDMAICEEVIEVSEESGGVKREVSGIPKVVELRGASTSRTPRPTLPPPHTQQVVSAGRHTSQGGPPHLPAAAAVKVEEVGTVTDIAAVPPPVASTTGIEPQPARAPSPPAPPLVMASDGSQHYEFILTDDNPDVFIKQLEQLTGAQVEVIVNEHAQTALEVTQGEQGDPQDQVRWEPQEDGADQ